MTEQSSVSTWLQPVIMSVSGIKETFNVRGGALVQVMMEAGPLHSRLLRYGPEHMRALKGSYCKRFRQRGSGFVITPNARRLIVRRQAIRSVL